MTNKSAFLGFLLFLVAISTWAQKDSLTPLYGNPRLYPQYAPVQVARDNGDKNQYIFEFDTLSLPFVDDFTENHMKSYYWDSSTAGVTIEPFYLFKMDTAYPVFYEAMYDTSYDYFYDSTNGYWDSTMNNETYIEFLDANTQQITFIDTVWPKPNGEIINGQLDTLNSPDTVYENTLDTIFTIPSSGDQVFWTDSDVFINRSYGMFEPTYGVATFDGLDSLGHPYVSLGNSSAQGIADYLTSAPIDMLNNPLGGVYTVADSVYFSFFVQPEGLGDRPEEADSLVLEFYDMDANNWVSMWNMEGQALTNFQQVFIKLEQGRWYRDGFRFRFKNYASLNGAFDHWNIDYVRLDVNRADAQNLPLDDVAFVGQGESIIQEYTKMPWSHFKYDPSLYMKSELTTTSYNNSDQTKNVRFGIEVYEGNSMVFQTNFSNNVEPVFQPATTVDMTIDITPFVLSDTANSQRYTFDVRSVLNTTPDVNRSNDTLIHKQDFGTFYAYDDGTAENGYYLVSSGAKMAVEYTVPIVDTMRAVNIYFPESGDDFSAYYFRVCVWSSLSPEVKVFESIYTNPIFSFDRNRVVRYDIDPLPVSGTFYVGIEQLNNPVVVGFDRNVDSQSKVFYNTDAGWTNASYTGSLMIHPEFDTIYYPWDVSTEDLPMSADEVNVFPNPAQDEVTINWNKEDQVEVSLLDISGRTLYRQSTFGNQTQIPLSNWNNGVYLIQIESTQSTQPVVKRLVISR